MKKLLITYFLFTFYSIAFGQINHLDKTISITAKGESIATVLKKIETKGEFKFSYSPNQIDVHRIINLNIRDQKLSDVLEGIFESKVTFKSQGDYIILNKNTKKDFYLSGYIMDHETGEQIENVSIYEPITLASSLSNQKGYYKIKLPIHQNEIDLRVSKENFDSQVVEIFGRKDRKLNIALQHSIKEKKITTEVTQIKIKEIHFDSLPQPEKPEMTIEFPDRETPILTNDKLDIEQELKQIGSKLETGKESFLNWFMTTKQNLHYKNIQDSLYRTWQVSLLPFVGTNHRLSPHVTNDFSFNVLGGYAGNINKAELGGIINLVRKNVTGVQIAGFANVVGNDLKGVQIAGSVNVDLGESKGAVISGLANINLKKTVGAQIAGGFNMAMKEMSGIQIAPVNYATNFTKGVQLGVVNISKVNSGVPIGLFSYAKYGGYRRLEIAYSELNDTELSFKTGVPKLYNIISSGFSYGKSNKPLLGLGYGLGTSWQYGKSFGSSFEIESSLYAPSDIDHLDYLSQNFKASLNFEAKLGSRIAFFVAPTINVYTSTDSRLDFSNYGKLLLADRDINLFGSNGKLYSWVGYKFGIRLCNKS
ncbi:hypothetical protein SAMN06298216_3111 [Spirosomataceae bacterium TFI 002]|nr:hypothetical protein SAMN06298216_3111 [Spirosomataceae bacterium TFI 002]